MIGRWAAVVALAASLGVPGTGRAQESGGDRPLPTPAERLGFQAFTAPEDVFPFLTALAEASGGFELDTLVVLNAGDNMGVPIPVARIPTASAIGETPAIRVLVLGSQHGTERAGLEVGLLLIRDLVDGELGHLRRTLDVRVIPMTNPLGVARRTRGAAGGVDLNRDHVALAAAETRAIWAEVADWRPHLVLDLHELGPTEYAVQIGVPTHPNVHPELATFARFYMLPQVANQLARADIWFHEYVAVWGDEDDEVEPYYTPAPLEAANARNAFALAGAVSFLVETASSRDVLGLARRTEQMYVATRAFLDAAVLLAVELARVADQASGFSGDALSIEANYAADSSGVQLPWVKLNERGLRVRTRLHPWRSVVEVDAVLPMPVGWIIEAAGSELVDALAGHGFSVEHLDASTVHTVRAYPVCPQAVGASALAEPESRTFPAGSWWIPANQVGARLLFTIVEPWSEDSWFADRDGDECAQGPYPVYRVPA